MPAPVAPTLLSIRPDGDEGYIFLSWVNPGSITGTKIERTLDKGATWSTIYDDAAITHRADYPIPTMQVGYRVSAKNGSGYGATITELGGILPLHGQIGFPMSLVSVDDPTQKVLALGVGDGSQLPGFGTVLSRSKIQPAGAVDPTYFYGTQRWRVAQGISLKLVPYNLQSGVRISPVDQMHTLLAMEGHTLLWRDAADQEAVYCTLANGKPQKANNLFRLVSCDLESVLPPTYPLTST